MTVAVSAHRIPRRESFARCDAAVVRPSRQERPAADTLVAAYPHQQSRGAMPEGRDPQPGIETLNGLPRKCEEPDDEAKQLLLDWWSQQG